MGREVRRVPPTWVHPKDGRGRYVPLYDCYLTDLADFQDMAREKGVKEAIEYYGGEPLEEDYMPDWPDSECTHYQMYEKTSEGTPISPVLPTPEDLARWLSDNKASTFADMTADYNTWLRMIKGSGSSVSAVIEPDGTFTSGVEFSAR